MTLTRVRGELIKSHAQGIRKNIDIVIRREYRNHLSISGPVRRILSHLKNIDAHAEDIITGRR